MPRSIWTGAITFGMISIPVKLYGATQNKDLSFNLLHDECKSRLRQKRWCPVHDREVTNDEIVRGYEYAKDQYVVISEQDLEELPVPSKHTIELTSFVKQDDIDPIYYETSYYLEPEQVGLKPYALLIRALKQKNVSAVAKIALRNRERPCILRPSGPGMVLETLYYPDEIRAADQPGVPDVLVSQPELNMAFSLIDMLQEPFQPEKYTDEYRTAMLRLIEAKVNGNEVVETPEAPAPAPTGDLMAALKASLEAARKSKEARDEPKRPDAQERVVA
jgi:DNA end-binding protein Ku